MTEVVNYSQSHFDFQGLENCPHLKTDLHVHQKETVEWMLYREEIPYENVRGGMLFSDMGTGKTLCALLCAVMAGGSTLILATAQLVYVWEHEIETHFENSVTFFTYHGLNRKKRFETFQLKNGTPTFIIMSLQSIPTDIDDENGPLRNLQFDRLIFDECHYIKNQHTKVFTAVSRLRADKKWFLSGTPIMNRLQEIYPYLKLLNFRQIGNVPQQPLRGRNGHVVAQPRNFRPLRKNDYLFVQNVLKNIAIRRTKDILDLPQKSMLNVFLDFSEDEKHFYETLKSYAQNRVKKLMRNIRRINSSGLPMGEINRVRMIILQTLLSLIFNLRLACCEPLMVVDKIPRTRNFDIKRAIEELSMSDERSSDCPVCYNDVAGVRNKKCGHTACADCWKKLSKMDNMICFSCFEETNLTELEIVESNIVCVDSCGVNGVDKAENSARINHTKRIYHISNKTQVILDLIKKELEKGNKIVVVSQWTTYLDIVISKFKMLHKDEPFVVLTGKTVPKKRQVIVSEFQKNENIKVCFASLGSSSEGITLHSASSMIICDPFWNFAKISQISDRIHRIGQKKDVVVYSVFVNDSIEIKLKELVAKKDAICRIVVDCAPITTNVESWLSRIIKLID